MLKERQMVTKEDLESFRNKLAEDVNNYIHKYIDTEQNPAIRSRLADYPDRKGHARRPLNLVLMGLAAGADYEMLLPLAAVIEMSENWVLMLDDIIDSSSMRRNAPSHHLKYGVENTINDAAMLQSMMWKMLFDYADKARMVLGDSTAKKIVDKVYEIGSLTYEGESADINILKEAGSIAKIGYDDYAKMASLKTAAYTVWGPLQLGAIVANARSLTATY